MKCCITEKKIVFVSLRVKHKEKAPETEADALWKDNVLSLAPCVFTVSTELKGLLQCVYVCVRELLLRQVVFIFMVLLSCVRSFRFLCHPLTSHTWQGLGIVVGRMQIQAVLE